MNSDKDVSISSVVGDAESVFWSRVAELYPHVKTGDMPPEVLVNLNKQLEEAVKIWLSYNE